MSDCPICSTKASSKYRDTPYWVCPACDCWFQDPMPPKTYIAEFEGDPQQMSEGDLRVNRSLAEWLFKNVMQSKPGHTLDIGAKLPVLAAGLKAQGCTAKAIDATGGFEYGDVNVIECDFEKEWIVPWLGVKFDLISLIHVFEHMYDPLATLRKLRAMISDTGHLFLRLPQHDVPGFERDLTVGHYSIHPFYHSLSSILEALHQTKTFVIERVEVMQGQRDLVLRPIKRALTVAFAMIVKNEERDLPKAIESLREAGEEVHVRVLDTGSTDKTPELLNNMLGTYPWLKSFEWRTYTAASEKDETGDWKLWDFSKARNAALQVAENSDADWISWIDADDVLATPAALRRSLYLQAWQCYSCWVVASGSKWVHHRLWRNGTGVRFQGRCHEYPILDSVTCGHLDQVEFHHNAAPNVGGENSNPRNLRMLLRGWKEDGPTARGAFYIANTYRDASKYEEAIEWYGKRVEFGEGFVDEYLFALLYKARCETALKWYGQALETLHFAQAKAPGWAEFIMLESQINYDQKNFKNAIYHATRAIDLPIPPTVLWREPQMYKDQPARGISWSHEHLGNTGAAIAWGHIAAVRIGQPDAQWQGRINRLQNPLAKEQAKVDEATAKIAAVTAPVIATKSVYPAIALNRPGAIGDIIMTLNLIPALKAANPGKQVWYFCNSLYGQPEQLGDLMFQAGVDQIFDSAEWDARSSSAERAISLVGYPLAEGYPEKPMRLHLLDYFASEMGIAHTLEPATVGGPVRAFGLGSLPSLTLRRPARPRDQLELPERYATLQLEAGWSKYKQWMPERWRDVMLACADIPFRVINKEAGLTLADSIALFANATMHIGIDSFCNHLTNYYWYDEPVRPREVIARRVPGVILWGSTQASAAGYPHNTNISKGLPCQPCFRENPAISRMPRGPCVNVMQSSTVRGMFVAADSYDDPRPHACMDAITVEEVVEAVRTMWKEAK